MTDLSTLSTKTIDELQELGKLTGLEKTIVAYNEETRKVTIDTIAGYIASILGNATPALMSLTPNRNNNYQSIIFIPEGETIDISERSPGCFYLEETKQSSIRTQMSIPTSVKVSSSLGLKRV